LPKYNQPLDFLKGNGLFTPGKMHIDSHLQIGTFHTHHCEDSLITAGITVDSELLAVMDGCSSGMDSHFCSTLASKLLRKIAHELYQLDFKESLQLPLPKLLEKILSQFMQELRSLQRQLQLSQYELLFTLILALVDTRKREAEVIVIGDGYVSCNGSGYEFDQHNRPDYLGYHLNERFTEWFPNQMQRLSFTNVQNLSISSDGILSFRPARESDSPEITDQEIINLLLNSPGKIKAKVHHIQSQHGLAPADDLGIVRLQFS
jgi:hypothetical protein